MTDPYDTAAKRRAAGIPEFDPNAGRGPYKPQGPTSIAGRVGGAFRSLPGELATAGRDAIRNPGDALGRVTAPLAGLGAGGLGNVGRLTNLTIGAGDTARTANGAFQAGRLGRSLLPGVRTSLGTAAGLTTVGLGLAEADMAQAEPPATASSPYALDPNKPTPILIEPGSSIAPPTKGRMQRMSERAAELNVDAVPQIDPGQPDGAQIMRSRTQGAVIDNPHAMSAIDQLSFASKRFKGSPSMRRAAADAILGGEQRKDANRQAELDANNATNAAVMKGDADAREMFAQRRLDAQAANAKLAEDRRSGDLDRQAGLVDSILRSGGRGGGVAKYGDASWGGKMYEDILEATGSPMAAAQGAHQAQVLAGVPERTPYDDMAMAQDKIGENVGFDRHANRWFGLGNKRFDPKTAKFSREADAREWWPGGAQGGDALYIDAQGNRMWRTGDSYPTDEPREQYRLRKRMEQQMYEGQ